MEKSGEHLEIERRFVIEYPDISNLTSYPGAVRYEIEQVYLPGTKSITERIRKRTGPSGTQYFHTIKRRLTDMTRVEDEREISEEEYNSLKSAGNICTASECRIPILSKTRWCLPYGWHTVEIDIYPFWRRIALTEVELGSENEDFSLPAFIRVIREVTGERRFTNKALAHSLLSGETELLSLENEFTGGQL